MLTAIICYTVLFCFQVGWLKVKTMAGPSSET